MKLSVVIPAHEEEESVPETVASFIEALEAAGVDHEVLVVDDGSEDGTWEALGGLQDVYPTLRRLYNEPPNGFGLAVRRGLEHFNGDAVAIVMADGSDDPRDLLLYHRRLEAGADCVFGSRFTKGGQTHGYPLHKLLVNRLANGFVRVLFATGYNDVTNAFKCYRREVIEGCRPLISKHFNLTVELPLKAIVRGYRYEVLPISWINRKSGVSKLKLREMGSRYLFIVLYLFLERHLSRGDYWQGSIPKGEQHRVSGARQ